MKAIQKSMARVLWRLSSVATLSLSVILAGCGSGSSSKNASDTANTPPVVVGSSGTTALDPNYAPPPPAAGSEPIAKDAVSR
jgi:ABC-type oligopeptide transport system substrate-binding subunit